ncbi:MAG: hypothetical protein P4L84_08930 [Isosphaeraceae bacterium]|nr:hypothetical protein [Isosphaeraceae bacterium]
MATKQLTPRDLLSALRKRRPRRRVSFVPQSLALEVRTMMSVAVPSSNPVVPLSTIFWNGEPDPLNPKGLKNIPSPEASGAAKTFTITNTAPFTIYPFLRGANTGTDPNSKAPFLNAPYDPQDPANAEYRLYVGYTKPGGGEFLGLPSGASITFQVPLVLWDGDNLFFATNGNGLTSAGTPYGYDPRASIAIAGTAPVSGSHWVQGSSGYPAGDTPFVMFYHDNTSLAVSTEALAQLSEVTFRDPYLTHFINDPDQSFPLTNYDVSFVNNMVAPASMEASYVPIYDGPLNAPKFYGHQSYGWTGSSSNTTTFAKMIKDFVNNQGPASIGKYFGGKGWPEYYNPNPNPTTYNIPSGYNLFSDSPLNTKARRPIHLSGFDSNYWNLTSAGSAPIQAGGAGVGFQGKVLASETNRIYLTNPSKQFVTDILQMLKAGTVSVEYPGPNPKPLAQVTSYHANSGGTPYVTVKTAVPVTGPSGSVYAFTRSASDYAITDITNLWYSWAQYNVQQHQNFPGETLQGTTTTSTNKGQTFMSNLIQLTQSPTSPELQLFAGMTVSAPDLPAGTTIVKVDGNDVYLSRIPTDTVPQTHDFTFGKPLPLPYDPTYTTPYQLSFDQAATPKAQLFAASVYEAMAAVATASTPSPYLPDSMNLVSQVIGFNVLFPDHELPGGPQLVGNIRDVVKSILRGVYDFNAVPDQSQWYPPPASLTPGLLSGQQFNVYNLDPYVWFVHTVQHLNAYGFSLDDDISNPGAGGPLVDQSGATNHTPNNVQIQFSGTSTLSNRNEWYPVIQWGELNASATIGTLTRKGPYQGYPVINLVDPKPTPSNPHPDTNYQTYLKINNPGTGQVGAYVVAPNNPGVIPVGTTLIYKAGLFPGEDPQIVMQVPKGTTVQPTSTPISINITAVLPQTLPSGGLTRAGSRAPGHQA